jgi:hypothetical protein
VRLFKHICSRIEAFLKLCEKFSSNVTLPKILRLFKDILREVKAFDYKCEAF